MRRSIFKTNYVSSEQYNQIMTNFDSHQQCGAHLQRGAKFVKKVCKFCSHLRLIRIINVIISININIKEMQSEC
jgi:hypothetical protein